VGRGYWVGVGWGGGREWPQNAPWLFGKSQFCLLSAKYMKAGTVCSECGRPSHDSDKHEQRAVE
jgi:hypothetical protein